MGRGVPTTESSPTICGDTNATAEKHMEFIVPFIGENISRCKCPQCPVQADSPCAQDKIKSSKEAMEYMPAGDIPKSRYIPGVYCSTGKSQCKDLNFEKQCICGSCEVWKEYNLGKAYSNNHFCQHGRST